VATGLHPALGRLFADVLAADPAEQLRVHEVVVLEEDLSERPVRDNPRQDLQHVLGCRREFCGLKQQQPITDSLLSHELDEYRRR
jgi:hypothetical protein